MLLASSSFLLVYIYVWYWCISSGNFLKQRECASSVAPAHYDPATGRDREDIHKCTSVLLVKIQISVVPALSLSSESTHIGLPLKVNITRSYLTLWSHCTLLGATFVFDYPQDATQGVWELWCRAVVACTVERVCVPAGVGTWREVQQLDFRKLNIGIICQRGLESRLWVVKSPGERWDLRGAVKTGRC